MLCCLVGVWIDSCSIISPTRAASCFWRMRARRQNCPNEAMLMLRPTLRWGKCLLFSCLRVPIRSPAAALPEANREVPAFLPPGCPPDRRLSAPKTARVSSVRPAPINPAKPTISPRFTRKDTLLTLEVVRLSTSRMTSPRPVWQDLQSQRHRHPRPGPGRGSGPGGRSQQRHRFWLIQQLAAGIRTGRPYPGRRVGNLLAFG